MRYDYYCKNCDAMWEVEHGMNEKPVILCPECRSKKTAIAITTAPETYTRGNGYLDVKGRRRDMHRYKLANDDPYAGMRQPGEADHIDKTLKDGGKRQKNPKTFNMNTKPKKK